MCNTINVQLSLSVGRCSFVNKIDQKEALKCVGEAGDEETKWLKQK